MKLFKVTILSGIVKISIVLQSDKSELNDS